MKNIIYILALILLTACSSFSDSEVKSKVSAELKNQFRHSRVISVEKVDEHDGIIRYEWVADYETLDGNFGIVTKIENQSTGYIDLYQNGDVADFRITSLFVTILYSATTILSAVFQPIK